jgi:hypothetical protein
MCASHREALLTGATRWADAFETLLHALDSMVLWDQRADHLKAIIDDAVTKLRVILSGIERSTPTLHAYVEEYDAPNAWL